MSDGHGGTKVVVVAANEKAVAAQGDSFQFKSLPAKHGEESGQGVSHYAAPVDHALGLDHAANESVTFYDIDVSHNGLHYALAGGDFVF